MKWSLDYILFALLTWGSQSIYHVKLVLNSVNFMIIGFIVATGVVTDQQALGKAYILLYLLILVCLATDQYTKKQSNTFDFIDTIGNPINVGTKCRKILSYSHRKHAVLMGFLAFLELLKILSAVYSVIAIYTIAKAGEGLLIVYASLAIVLFESLLGLILYTISTILISIRKDFFMKWMNWKSKWYLADTIDCHVTKSGHRLYLEMREISDSEASHAWDGSTPHVAHELAKIILGSSSRSTSTSTSTSATADPEAIRLANIIMQSYTSKEITRQNKSIDDDYSKEAVLSVDV